MVEHYFNEKNWIMKKLTGYDYLTKLTTELNQYPDYSPHAGRIVNAIMEMTSEEIEKIDITEGNNKKG